MFCDVGSIIYIRNVDAVNEVAYYSVNNRYSNGSTPNGGVQFLVSYIDSDSSTFTDGQNYYIGYVTNNTALNANSSLWISNGINTPANTIFN